MGHDVVLAADYSIDSVTLQQFYSSSFPPVLAPPPASSFFPPPPRRLPSQAIPGICAAAAGGYSLPPILTRGSQLHLSFSGTLSRTLGTWLPQPRHDFFAERTSQISLDDRSRSACFPFPRLGETYNTWRRWLQST